MTNYIGRQNHFSEKINSQLSKLTGIKADFYSKLTIHQIIELKTALSDINNLLTLRMTIAAVNWLTDFCSLNAFEKEKALSDIDKIKPNTSGFDLYFPEHRIIGEVKCVIPVNKGEKYGSAQWTSILKDAVNLFNGKKPVNNPKSYIKFLFLLDLGSQTDGAINDLIKTPTSAKEDSEHYERHQMRNNLSLITDSDTFSSLTTEKVYIKKIKLT